MESRTSFPSTEGNRRRPLHTCGLSFLVMVHKSYTKAQEINGPIGSLTKKLAQLFTWAGPIIYAMQYQWLAILSFADDGILSLERAIETVFPPSIHVFNKIDQLVQTAENLPRKFDDAVDNFPATIRKVPAIDGIWCLFRNLTRCDSEHTKEKEISVDENCNSESASVEAKADSPKQKEIEKKAICAAAKLNVKRGSYKEALENKTKKNRGGKEEIQEDKMTKGEHRENNEMMMKSLNEHPIMELFETAWLMKPVRREN